MWRWSPVEVPSTRQRRALMHSRNAGLQRLRSLTKKLGVAAAVLTGVFAGIAAAGNSGHHRRAATRRVQPRTRRPTASPTRTTAVPAPPSLPQLGEQGFGTEPAAPQAPVAQPPPAVTQAPPHAVTRSS